MVEGGRGGDRTGTKEAEGCIHRREKPLGPTGTLVTLRAEKGGSNGRG